MHRQLRIGIVCPYSFDVPGGVGVHIVDLARTLIARGHHVSVLAPAGKDTDLPAFVTSAGRATAIPYNGSVARLSLDPRAGAHVRRWLSAGAAGQPFDVIHIHEPLVPTLSLLALWQATCPVVATFHSGQDRSRILQAAYPLLRSSLDKIAARIAVSEDARRTAIEHIGGDAVIIPNGVCTSMFADAEPNPAWLGRRQPGNEDAPTIAFLSRLDEPRKGLHVLARAIPDILSAFPGARFLVAGEGDTGRAAALDILGPQAARSVQWLGRRVGEDKAALFRSVDLYVAPHTGQESFGMVLTEAMAAGTGVVSSDIGPFFRVLDGGRAGALFRAGNHADLARVVVDALTDQQGTQARRAHASAWVRRFDWQVVTNQLEAVYDMAVASHEALPSTLLPNSAWIPGVTSLIPAVKAVLNQ